MNVKNILSLIEEFPRVGRIDFSNNDHRQFINEVLMTVKHAKNELISLAPYLRQLPDPKSDWFLTFSGIQFYPLNPMPETICIEDIAHHLSMIPRFGGAARDFYSVAQHCVFVSRLVPPELALVGLMHDATEAYCNDLVRPLKYALPNYMAIEDLIWRAVAAKFNLPQDLDAIAEVKHADDVALMTERRDLLIPTNHKWSVHATPADLSIVPVAPKFAESSFLLRFSELTTLTQTEATSDEPSIASPSVPETAHNSHSPSQTQSGDTYASNDRKPGTSCKTASEAAKLNVPALKAGPNRPKPKRSQSRLPAARSLAATQPPAPPATVVTVEV
jgi:hypothetical protein